jgi:hypothetical protein
MLSLGLVLAFSASAMAVDVKFSGSFYAAGMYLDKTTLRSDTGGDVAENISTAFYYQRLRVQTDFIVSPGLKLVTRFDAMERAWGAARTSATATNDATLTKDSAGTTAENENIAFDWAYIEYASPIGLFQVGYMNLGATGTIFSNSSVPAGRIKYSYTIGPATINADITKVKDKSLTAKNAVTYTDADNDSCSIEGVYAITKDAKAGMKVTYYNYAEYSPTSLGNYKKKYFLFTPYAIVKTGPVEIQAEVNYATGSAKKFGDSIGDVSLSNLSAFVDATATFGPVYFGGTFAYISGDDPGTSDKQEGGTLSGGLDWNPTLIMFNYYDRTYWAGNLAGSSTNNAGPMGNDTSCTTSPGAWFGQGRIGVRPITALDIMASLSYAQADKKPGIGAAAILNNSFGWEVDVTGTYKITNNLSYMMGVGYWFVGDYYKGTSNTNSVQNDFMLINKLTLTF